MDWVIRNRDYETTRIVESVDVLELKQIIQSKGVECKVLLHHCDSDFWLTKREANQRSSCSVFGTNNLVTGKSNLVLSQNPEERNDMRPIADDKMVLITITFSVGSEGFENVKSHKFDLTTNYLGNTYNLWCTSKIYVKVPYICGVYKVEGFDEAFNDVKQLNQNMTEKQFAYDDEEEMWNSDLTEIKLYNGGSRCIDKITKYKNIDSGKLNVSLTLLSIDVKNNLEYIEKIFSSLK
jgi:hypothetical protein